MSNRRNSVLQIHSTVDWRFSLCVPLPNRVARRIISPESCYLRCDANDTVTDFEMGLWTENEERHMCYCGQDCSDDDDDDDDDECCGDYGEFAHNSIV